MTKKSNPYKSYKWDTIYDNTPNNKFIINIKNTQLLLSCCDCGSTHLLDFKLKGKNDLQIELVKDRRLTAYLRRTEFYRYKK